MDFGTVLSVAQTLFAALQCSQLRQMWSIMGYKSELEDLSRTVNTVRAVLLDAEAKQDEISHEARVWLEELKDAVYDADDLLDEFVTIAAQKQQMKSDKFSKKVSLFFSHFKEVGVAYNMSQGVKKIKKKLDAIAVDHSKFGLGLDHKPIRKKREETYSYLKTGIIGREEDVEKIVSKLVDSDVEQDVSFLSVVGIGGMGKTALAQCIFNDDRITQKFSLRLWACVADQDQKQLDIKAILRNILESATRKNIDSSSLELLQRKIREQVAGKRYLLVLDDLWTEKRNEWLKLLESLGETQRGCWIVVTTRSMETAKIVGGGYMHKLQGLSKENSMHLFTQFAFGPKQSNPSSELVTIGQQIVESCVGVPLAIRVAGSLLYGQETSKWLSFQESRLAKLRGSQDEIMPILKLSYHNLDSPLKSCFSYLALFPKDFWFRKEELIILWIAQGFVVPLDEGQSIEEAAEDYFLILLRRCFFQDVNYDRYGKIFLCKMHDLIHDVAQEVAGKEICTLNALDGGLDRRARHVFMESSEYPNCSFTKTDMRTYLRGGHPYDRVKLNENYVGMLLSKLICLRTLDLGGAGILNLPSSIGNLLHLRYLNLAYNEMEMLPKSITRLYNLKILVLLCCLNLKELPKDVCKLVNLGVLDIRCCDKLTCLPLGIGKLTCLQILTRYCVGKASSTCNLGAEMEGLKALEKLKGTIQIEIHFPISAAYVKEENIGGAYLRNKQHLDGIEIYIDHEGSTEGNNDQADALMEELQPHSNLRSLRLEWQKGGKMPSWARGHNLATSLPLLFRLNLSGCRELRCIPSLGTLQHLKFLSLERLPDLEYVDEKPEADYWVSRWSCGEGFSLLPCLEEVFLWDLPKFKGWWGRSVGQDHVSCLDNSSDEQHSSLSSSISLPQLKLLCIINCPELVTNLQCPSLQRLRLKGFNVGLRINKAIEKVRDETHFTSFSSPPDRDAPHYKLRDVQTDRVGWLQQYLPTDAFKCLRRLEMCEDEEVESLMEVWQLFRSCSSSLQSLYIWGCPNLRSLCGGLEHLSALKSLSLNIPMKTLTEEKENGLPWKALHHTLLYLDIHCGELQSLPSWIQKLTSLRDLRLFGCSEGLKERCGNPSGEDWPLIQHVPTIRFIPSSW